MLFRRLDMDNNNIIEINNLSVSFLSKKLFQKSIKVNAVNNLSLEIKKNSIYGLVGESGCGKTTTAKSIAKLINISSGDINYYNQNITNLSQKEFRKYRKNIQIIFQDPYSSLNPRIKVGDIVEIMGKINKVGNTSIEVDLIVYATTMETGKKKLVTEGTIKYVKINNLGEPTPVKSSSHSE